MAFQRPARFHRGDTERPCAQTRIIIPGQEFILDLQREIENLLGLGVLPQLQIGVDQIVECVNTVFGGATVPLGLLRGDVGIEASPRSCLVWPASRE